MYRSDSNPSTLAMTGNTGYKNHNQKQVDDNISHQRKPFPKMIRNTADHRHSRQSENRKHALPLQIKKGISVIYNLRIISTRTVNHHKAKTDQEDNDEQQTVIKVFFSLYPGPFLFFFSCCHFPRQVHHLYSFKFQSASLWTNSLNIRPRSS